MKHFKLTSIILSLSVFLLISCTFNTDGGDPENECHQSKTKFGNVEIQGSFAHDVGCMYTSMTIDGKEYTYKKGLEIIGKRVVASKDKTLILDYIEELYYQHASVVGEENSDFINEKKKFQSSTIEISGEKTVITTWINEDVSMQPIEIYKLQQITLLKNGTSKVATLDHFSHDI